MIEWFCGFLTAVIIYYMVNKIIKEDEWKTKNCGWFTMTPEQEEAIEKEDINDNITKGGNKTW